MRNIEIARVNNKPVRLFKISFDTSLFYLIKKTTGDSDVKILSYFYDLGVKLFNDSVSKKVLPRKCNRAVELFYKKSDIHVKFEVMSTYLLDNHSDFISLIMRISFPRKQTMLTGADFIQLISETSLGLSDESNVHLYESPQEKLYKCIKDPQSRS